MHQCLIRVTLFLITKRQVPRSLYFFDIDKLTQNVAILLHNNKITIIDVL